MHLLFYLDFQESHQPESKMLVTNYCCQPFLLLSSNIQQLCPVGSDEHSSCRVCPLLRDLSSGRPLYQKLRGILLPDQICPSEHNLIPHISLQDCLPLCCCSRLLFLRNQDSPCRRR